MYDDPLKKKTPSSYEDLSRRLSSGLPTPTNDGGDSSVASVVDDEFSKLGYNPTARLSILGDVGRENGWNRNTIFQGHIDPASYTNGRGQINNRGIISWNGPRREALDNHLKQEGVYGKNNDDELRGMVRFMDKELQTGYPDAYNRIRNASTTADASRALQSYIRYEPGAPYNTPNPDFVTRNNAAWAKKAKALGLASAGGVPAAPAFDDEAFKREVYGKKYQPSEPVATPGPTNPSTQTLPSITPPQTVPESPDTLDAQLVAANDENSTKAGVLLTRDEEQNVDPSRLTFLQRVEQPDGRALYVNPAKAKAMGVTDYTADMPKLIGKVTPVDDTSQGNALRSEAADGTELSTSIVAPGAEQAQAAADQSQFPGQVAKQEVMPAQDAAQKRLEEDTPPQPPVAPSQQTGTKEQWDEYGRQFEQYKTDFDAYVSTRKAKYGLEEAGRISESVKKGELSTDADYADFRKSHGNLPDTKESADLYNQTRRAEFETKKAAVKAKNVAALRASPGYPLYKKFLEQRPEFSEGSPESVKAFTEAMDKEQPKNAQAAMQVAAKPPQRKIPSDYQLAPNQESVPEGYRRFINTKDNETYIINPTTGKVEDESMKQVAEKIPIQLVPLTQKTTTPVEEAQKQEALQIAPQLAQKYGVSQEDVYQYLLQAGFVDINTGKPLSKERYYQSEADFARSTFKGATPATMSAPGEPAPSLGEARPDGGHPEGGQDTYNLSRRGLQNLLTFAQDQEKTREDAALKLISEGHDLTDEQLREKGINVEHFRSSAQQGAEVTPTAPGRAEDIQMAETKGQVKRKGTAALAAQLKATGNYDDYTAGIEARVQKGLVDRQAGEEEIAAANRQREEVARDWTAPAIPIITGTGYGAAKAGGLEPTPPEVTQQNIDRQLGRLVHKYGSFTDLEKARAQEQAAEAARQEVIKNSGWLEYFGRMSKALGRGVVKGAAGSLADYLQGAVVWTKPAANLIDSLLGTKASKIEDHPFSQFSQWYKGMLDRVAGTDKVYDPELFGGQIGQGIGSSLGMIPASLGGEWPIALFSTLQMGGAGYQDARQAGASDADAQKFALVNSGLFGWTEIVGVGEALQRLNKGPAARVWKKLFLDALKESGEEVFLNEGPQQLGENLVAKNTYDPDRKWDKGVADAMLSAGLSAPIISTAITMLLHLRNRRMIKSKLASDAKNGGQAVRYFGENELYVNQQKVPITPEIQEALDTYTATGERIQKGVDKIDAIQTKMGSRRTSEGLKQIQAINAQLRPDVIRQQLNAATIESMSGVPKTDITDQADATTGPVEETPAAPAQPGEVAVDHDLQRLRGKQPPPETATLEGKRVTAPFMGKQVEGTVKSQEGQKLVIETDDGRTFQAKQQRVTEIPAAPTVAEKETTIEKPKKETPVERAVPEGVTFGQPLKKTAAEELPSRAEFPDSLGIPRAEMPQIRADDHAEFEQFAKEKGVELKTETVKASELKPTQIEYNPRNAAGIPEEKLKAKRLMVSSDNRILDGHNMLTRIQEDPNADVNILRVPLKAKEALELMRSFPKATTKTVEQVGRTEVAGEKETAPLKKVEPVKNPDEIANRKEDLPEDPWRYFKKDVFDAAPKVSKMVPIGKLVTVEDLDAKHAGEKTLAPGTRHPVARAFNNTAASLEGTTAKRDPIEVHDRGDGTYYVADGNATTEMARRLGWKELPVTITKKPAKSVAIDKGIVKLSIGVRKHAEKTRGAYWKDVRATGHEIGGVVPGNIQQFLTKSKKSLKKKLKLKSDKVPTDLMRSTIIIPASSTAQAQATVAKAIDAMGKRGYKIYVGEDGKPDVTNRFADPAPGYKDISIKLVRDGDPVIRELQFLQPAAYLAKQGVAVNTDTGQWSEVKGPEPQHVNYDRVKDLQDEIYNNSKLSPEKVKEYINAIVVLNEIQAQHYGKAFAQDTAGSPQPSSTMARPSVAMAASSRVETGVSGKEKSLDSAQASMDLMSDVVLRNLSTEALSSTERASKFLRVSSNISTSETSIPGGEKEGKGKQIELPAEPTLKKVSPGLAPKEEEAVEERSPKISEADQKSLAKQGFNIVRQRISGAPYFIRNAKDVAKQVAKATKDAMSDRARPEDKVWYQEAGRAIREYAHGDRDLMEKMVRVTAKLSQTAGVQHNADWVIKAFQQIARGETPATGRYPNEFAKEVAPMLEAEVFDTNIKGVKEKLQNFYRNLHDAAFEENKYPDDVVIDMHAAGYIWQDPAHDKAVGNQYDYAERVMQLATDRYNKLTGENIKPSQMQSLLWGIWKRESAKSSTQAGQQEEAWNYPKFWERASANLTAEVLPSTRLPEGQALSTLSYEDKLKYQTEALHAAMGDQGQGDLLKQAGVALYKQRTGSGGYEGATSPNQIVGSLVPKRTSDAAKAAGRGELYDYEAVDKLARGWQYIFQQDGVPWFRADTSLDSRALDKLRETRKKVAAKMGVEPTPTPAVSRGVFLDFGEPMTRDQEAEFFSLLRQELGENAGYTNMGDGRIAIINYRDENGNPFGLSDDDFSDKLENVYKLSGAKEAIKYGAETRYHYHDWQADPEGAALLGEATDRGGPDWEKFIRDRRDAVDAVNTKWVKRAREQEGGPLKAVRPGDVTGGPAVRTVGQAPDEESSVTYGEATEGAVAVHAVHYSGQPRTSLDSSKWGTGLKGGEAKRVMQADDPRLRQRIYFYTDTGNGVAPEGGVGNNPHYVSLQNVYDGSTDPLGLKPKAQGDANRYETSVLDAGYDGYFEPGFGKQGAVVLLGPRTIDLTAKATPVQTDTPAFKKWFGDSKVVDENGEPLRVYHGTNENVESFDVTRIGSKFGMDRDGFFFTSSPAEASDFAMFNANLEEQEGANVMPVYLSLQNPIVRTVEEGANDEWDNYRDDILKEARRKKADGVIIRSQGEDGDLFVAFKPTQIKSAIGNVGTFDVNEPSILKRAATAESKELRRHLQTAEATAEVYTGTTGGTIHPNGEVELTEHDAEVVRRILAEQHFQRTGSTAEELPFDGMVLTPRQLGGLAETGRKVVRPQLVKAGATDEMLKGYDELLKTLQHIADTNKGHTVAFVYDDALPHERVHKEDLDAGRVTAAGLKELQKHAVWNTKGTAFDRAYPNISDVDKASELAAILASGEAAEYGLKGTAAEKAEYLSTWAKDIVDNNIDNINRLGAEAWAKQFPTISSLAQLQSYENVQAKEGATEVAKEAGVARAAPGEAGEGGPAVSGEGAVQAQAPAIGKTEARVAPSAETSDASAAREFSLHYQKVKEQFQDILGPTYEPTTLKEQAQKAYDLIQKDKPRAMRIVYGIEKPPAGLKQPAVAIMMAQSLPAAGKMSQAQTVGRLASSMLTEAAQELNMAKMDIGEPMRLERAIENVKLARLGKSLNLKGQSELEAGRQKVKTKAVAAAKAVNATATSITSADKLLEMLTAPVKKVEPSILKKVAPPASFKDSKVVDENGKLKEVYHGTSLTSRESFSETPEEITFKHAPIFFAEHPTRSAIYAKGEKAATVPVYLDIKNPYITKDYEFFAGGDTEEGNIYEDYEFLQDEGYDGAVWTDEHGSKVWAAFNPDQISSTISGPTEAAPLETYASMWEDQFPSSHPASGPATKYNWREVANYPISDISDAPNADWMRGEMQMWADEGEPDRYGDMVTGPLRDPVTLVEVGKETFVWDGYHRLGASVLAGRQTVRAIVGQKKEAGPLKKVTPISKDDSQKLKDHFATTGTTVADLYNMDSAGRRAFFEGAAVDTETARSANVLFEKAMLSNQKQALKNWIWKNLYNGVPLYTNVTVQEAQTLRNKFDMKALKGMTKAQRQTELANIYGARATELNDRFEKAQRAGNLANWERRVMGTDKMLQDKRLKGAFARLETMNDLGVLTPPAMNKFMEDYVSDQMGISITADQSLELSKKTEAVSKAFDAANTDWTADNRDAVVDYFKTRKDLENYIASLDPKSSLDVFVDVGARGSMLFSLRSLSNNLFYQVAPAMAQGVIKRLASGNVIPGDYTAYEKATAAIAGRFAPTIGKKMAEHVKMAMRIYKDTGYDISRMESLDDGFRYFGEQFTHTEGPSWKESQGIKARLNYLVRGHAKLMTPGLKWAAGGTDTLIANIHRADTSMMLARIIAAAEEKKGTLVGTKEERMNALFKESMNPNPQTDEGRYIREAGIMDANHANFTNNDIYGRISVKLRDAIGLGDATIGKVLVPFIKIPAQSFGIGLEMATGIGLIRGTKQVIQGLRMDEGVERQIAISEGLRKLLTTSGGIILAALFMGMLLDDDDYIGAYDYAARSENKLDTTKNAGADMFRIGGNWYSTKWLGPLGIPVAAFMTARQTRAKGGSYALGYLTGILTGLTQFPGIKEGGEWLDELNKAKKAGDLDSLAKATKFTGADIGKWVASRSLTSLAAQDIWGFVKPSYRYDSLGRRVPDKGDTAGRAVLSLFVGANVKPDTSNAITDEFERLEKTKNLPTLADPDTPSAKKLEKSAGKEKYIQYLNTLKQDYAEKVAALIESPDYKNAPAAAQEKAINKLRQATIMKPLQAMAELQ